MAWPHDPFRSFYKSKDLDIPFGPRTPALVTRLRRPYRVTMLRFLLLIGAVVVVVMVVSAVLHLLFLLVTVALVFCVIGLMFGVFHRVGRRTARRR
jgi:Flp pilus assembly protein TadB